MQVKNFKASILLFVLLSSIAESSSAAKWFLITQTQDIKIFIDMESLRISGPKIKVWEKWVYARPQEVLSSSPKKTYSSEKILAVYRCDERASAFLQINEYADRDGSSGIVQHFSYPDVPSLYTQIVPDSLNEHILKFICGIKRAPKQI